MSATKTSNCVHWLECHTSWSAHDGQWVDKGDTLWINVVDIMAVESLHTDLCSCVLLRTPVPGYGRELYVPGTPEDVIRRMKGTQ